MAYTTIDNPELYFQTELWTGDQSENARTLDGSEDMQPDFVWVKGRSFADTGGIFDSVRGATKMIIPSANSAESTIAQSLKSFDSDGFTMGTESALNKSSNTMVAWCWKAGTTSGISGGSITPSAVSINTTSGFGIYKYTGSGDAKTIAHGLGISPIVIVKKTSGAEEWDVGGNFLATGVQKIVLNVTAAALDEANAWDSTFPSSTLVSLNNAGGTNTSGGTYIMYAFAPIQGYSKFGKYTGNGNADGTFVYTGFKPAFVMTKGTAVVDHWFIWDNKRDGYNVDNNYLYASGTGAEQTTTDIDLLSNGFKFRNGNTGFNGTGINIYMAFAEAPFVNSNGVPCNAR